MRKQITNEIHAAIGKTAELDMNGLIVLVRITNTKCAYGTVRAEVTPVAGSGSIWVMADRLTNSE